jgi:hypothetical protein
MIVKAVVESVIDPYHVKIRVPLLDRDKSSSIHTSDSDLDTATICSLPNCRLNLQVGDIVFVATEKTYPVSQPVILGVLFRENATSSMCDLVLGELFVENNCTLPKGTTIGEISYSETRMLSGATDNIQAQINALVDRISVLEGYHKSTDSTGGQT